MIDYVRGKLADKDPSIAIVEAHGIGYEISVPLSTSVQLPDVGKDVVLYTHFHVREDIQKLYGFLTKGDRELFRQLIGVSSIGPKTALSVLSKVSADDFARAVAMGEPSLLGKIPGVGAKTAERLMLELKGKFKLPDGASPASAVKSVGSKSAKAIKQSVEAYEALVSLGYVDKQVQKALDRVRESLNGAEATVEEWIRRALQVI